MPDEQIPMDAVLADTIDRICEARGFATREQAVEWLIKRRLSRGLRQISMRGRALHLIRSNRDPL